MAMILERNSLWYSDNDNLIRLLVSDVLNILYAPVAHIVRIAELALLYILQRDQTLLQLSMAYLNISIIIREA